MKATAVAHPIQGLLKYHGFRNPDQNIPYHDSISVCTAPSRTTTTVEFGYEQDSCLVNNDQIDTEGYKRVTTVLDLVRERSGVNSGAHVKSKNTFPSNVGLGASASAYAALSLAACHAAELTLDRTTLSALARQGAASAARSVTGGFSHLRTSMDSSDCIAERINDGFDKLRIIACHIPMKKFTSRAHDEAPTSHLYQGRLAYIHETLARLYPAIRAGDFETTFQIAEYDSISLLAATMTAEGWIYWAPETLEILELARKLRRKGISVYFSCDTGATAYLNTLSKNVDMVIERTDALGIDTDVWRVGDSAHIINGHLF